MTSQRRASISGVFGGKKSKGEGGAAPAKTPTGSADRRPRGGAAATELFLIPGAPFQQPRRAGRPYARRVAAALWARAETLSKSRRSEDRQADGVAARGRGRRRGTTRRPRHR